MTKKTTIIYAFTIAFLITFLPQSLWAKEEAVKLSTLIKLVSEHTNEPYVTSKYLSDSSFALSNHKQKINKSQFRFMLAQEDLVLQQKNGINYINKISNVKPLAPTIWMGEDSKMNDFDFVSTIIKLNHVDPSELLSVLQKLTPSRGYIGKVGKNILISSYYTNIKQMAKLIETLDTQENAAYYKSRKEWEREQIKLKVKLKEAEAKISARNKKES